MSEIKRMYKYDNLDREDLELMAKHFEERRAKKITLIMRVYTTELWS